MTHTGVLIGVSYAALVVLGLLVALGLGSSTNSGQGTDPGLLARREKGWLIAVVLTLGVLLVGTVFFVPYGESADDGGRVVRVEASQFTWRVDPARVPAGVPVEFRLTSADVNHGFGVYDPDDRLITQVQVMPGRTQRLVHTFDEPGTYRILCLEYCGLAHHGMVGQFEVAAQ